MLKAYPRRRARLAAEEEGTEEGATASYSRTAVNAVIGLLVTLIGTGILSLFTIYVKVATLTDAIAAVTETQKRQLSEAVSERQYQRDQAAVYEAIRGLATKQEVANLAIRLEDQTQTLSKIEDAVQRIEQGKRAGR